MTTRRTVYPVRYLADETYRRRIGRATEQRRERARCAATSPTPTRAPCCDATRTANRAHVVFDRGYQRDRVLGHRVSQPRRRRRRDRRRSTRRYSPTSGPPTTPMCTSTAPTPSTSMVNSPSSTLTATAPSELPSTRSGRCRSRSLARRRPDGVLAWARRPVSRWPVRQLVARAASELAVAARLRLAVWPPPGSYVQRSKDAPRQDRRRLPAPFTAIRADRGSRYKAGAR